MAKAFTQEVCLYKPITLIIETPQEARALRNLLGGSTGNPMYAVFQVYLKEYIKQKEVIDNAIS